MLDVILLVDILLAVDNGHVLAQIALVVHEGREIVLVGWALAFVGLADVKCFALLRLLLGAGQPLRTDLIVHRHIVYFVILAGRRVLLVSRSQLVSHSQLALLIKLLLQEVLLLLLLLLVLLVL